MNRTSKRLVAATGDVAITFFAVWLAFYLRLGDWINISEFQWLAVAASLAAIPFFWVFGLYRAISRYLGFDALLTIARACLVYGLLYATIFTFFEISGVPRTVGIIQPILLFVGVAASRGLARYVLGNTVSNRGESTVIIYGAGSSGRQLAAAIAGGIEMRVAGFVDDDPTLWGAVLNGRRIYAPRDLPKAVNKFGVTDILLALPSASRLRRSELLELLRPLSVNVRTLPGFMDVASGKVQVEALRPLDIEDLLGRDTAAPNAVLFSKNILGKTVLVTGAGGSIGSELCRQIVAAGPKALLLVEMSEFALYAIDAELRQNLPLGSTCRIVPLLGSVRDADRIDAIMAGWRPETVYHAAAYKHVPLVEHNPVEGVLNNVMGTMVTARAAIANEVSDFVLISTDKAVRPTNVMGTTKRLAEMCLQALAAEGVTTRLSMVRFGNVLGSSGSVVPLFRRQIASGGPVTITHADITRYFMTIPEAAQLVIQASAMATGGEVFVLDMGEPVRIADLARKMIELSGFTVRDDDNPEGEIAIEVIGLRPGEKLYEELLIGNNPTSTSHPLIMKALEAYAPIAVIDATLAQLAEAIAGREVEKIHTLLRERVPEFASTDGLVDWIYLEQSRGGEASGTGFQTHT